MKLCVITTSRADYGLLFPLLERIHQDPETTLQLIVSGTHLSPEHGLTIDEIKAGKIPITQTLDIQVSSGSFVGIAKTMGLGMISFSQAYAQLEPDLVVILGDRSEMFAAAASALVAQIPIAHIHGGELTEGAIDDSLRHGITKMSHLHFVAAEEYRRRVIQLGESPDSIFHVGALGVENVHQLPPWSRARLEQSLAMPQGTLDDPIILMTFHPQTIGGQDQQLNDLLQVLTQYKNRVQVITMPNADAQGHIIRTTLRAYANGNKNVFLYDSLGRERYLSLIRYSAFVIGNSSSGVLEVPALRRPTVNVGDRQKGRIMPKSVINVACNPKDIQLGIEKALSDQMQQICKTMNNPLESRMGGTSQLILNIVKDRLKTIKLNKHFYDVEFTPHGQ